jgi:hypothetical protein
LHLPRPLPSKGPILEYLDKLRLSGNRQAADDATRAAIAALQTPDGASLLQLLEVVTYFNVPPIDASHCASTARNAQALIASDLRRLLTDETQRLLNADDA